MTDKKRLIEVAFPLKQTSIDSVHEKNVRHGHISTLHIWPARRPLAACRAALIATLLPDPGNKKERDEILDKLGGKIVSKAKTKKLSGGKIQETYAEETIGGILHWGRESSADLDWFREKIKEAYGGRAPKVLDPFAGGGAIPLEAMRLGCEATAIDINPVAWFILKCTLEYPQKLAGKKLPLPDFVLKDRDFMESFFKAQGLKGSSLKKQLEKLGLDKDENWIPGLNVEAATTLEADLAWHVRAWGWWILQQARKDLAKFYPTYADFEPLKESDKKWEQREMKRVPILEDGNLDLKALNEEFSEEYLKDSRNPRWILEDAPVGACILYAVSCGLSDKALADQFDILMRTGGKSKDEDDEEDEEEETTEDADIQPEEGTGSKVKLQPWQQRKRKTMGYEAAGGRPIPLIDQAHRLMHLWKAGDVVKVDQYLDDKGLRRDTLFHQLLQALIELADVGSDERALIESISNHVVAKGGTDQLSLPLNN